MYSKTIYISFIYLIILIGFSVYFSKWSFKQLYPKPFKNTIPNWDITYLDFFLFLWIVIFGHFSIHYALDGLERLGVAIFPTPLKAIIGGLGIQLILGSLFLGFICFNTFNFQTGCQLSTNKTITATCKRAFYYAIGSLVPLMLISWMWEQVLNLPQLIGIEINPTQQELVEFISNQTYTSIHTVISLFSISIAPWTEELLFRAGIYRFLKGHMTTFQAAGISSLIFAGIHCNLMSLMPLFCLGMFLCCIYEREETIYTCILVHMLFNANSLILILIQNLFH
jgi:membrane protease YdiL (CAAX protease family)